MRVFKVVVRWILNFWWRLSGGVIFLLLWCFIGILFAITLVGLPVSRVAFRLAYFTYKPFYRDAVILIDEHLVANILWSLTFGLAMLIVALVWLLALIISIIGIPLIYQWCKVVKVVLFPFGAEIM